MYRLRYEEEKVWTLKQRWVSFFFSNFPCNLQPKICRFFFFSNYMYMTLNNHVAVKRIVIAAWRNTRSIKLAFPNLFPFSTLCSCVWLSKAVNQLISYGVSTSNTVSLSWQRKISDIAPHKVKTLPRKMYAYHIDDLQNSDTQFQKQDLSHAPSSSSQGPALR